MHLHVNTHHLVYRIVVQSAAHTLVNVTVSGSGVLYTAGFCRVLHFWVRTSKLPTVRIIPNECLMLQQPFSANCTTPNVTPGTFA